MIIKGESMMIKDEREQHLIDEVVKMIGNKK